MTDPDEILESFLMQYYSEHQPPEEILINFNLDNIKILREAITDESGV
ncbi:MAG: hypothetical protein Ct9H300mP6_14390 [Gammaproteobacteria bacterium]|nr:MAG: hypothetical protein Ct9H300mP6_14390 [Gammaproteobacteria bacterium]